MAILLNLVKRCLFNSRTRQPEESVATFVNELHGIASKCEYGLQLNENLKLKCRQYPAIHTDYSCSNCTISN